VAFKQPHPARREIAQPSPAVYDSSMSAPQHDKRNAPRSWLWLGGSALLALHLLLCNHFIPLRTVLRPEPVQGDDFDLHIGQTFRVLKGLDGWGNSWVYDVQLLAGQPEGTIFDADNKGCELWTFALWKLGVNKAVAFNSFLLLAAVLGPLIVFTAARLFSLGAGASLVAAALASALFFFDSFSHWVWFVGMISYAFASYLALLPLALFHRFLESGRAWTAATCACLLGIAHVVHPYTFFMLALPMAALYARSFRGLKAPGHAAVVGIGAVTLAFNLYWLRAALAHWHYVLNSAYYGQTGLSYLTADFFDVLKNPTDTGVIGTRTGFRFLCIALAAGGLFAWRRTGDRRLLPLGSALGCLLAMAYLGAYLPGAAQVQPYRHVLPAAFFATVPAAAFVQSLWRAHALEGLQHGTRALLAVAAVLIAQHLGTEALYFLPGLFPDPPPLVDGSASPISKYGYIATPALPGHVDYVLPHPAWLESGADDVVSWVADNVPKGGRVLVDNGVIGERIAWKTQAEVIGGFRERNIAHAYANFFRRYADRQVAPAELARYLHTFAIGWVITQRPRADLANARDVLERLPSIAGRWVYRVRAPSRVVLQGTGSVSARTNRIDLRGSDPTQSVVLSYHFHEALRCEPACRVERAPVDLDAVGLIRIPAPHPANLAIVNGY
jgi:hypothetical protein